MKSNIKKSIIVIVSFAVCYLLFQLTIIKTASEGNWTVFGYLAKLVAGDNEILRVTLRALMTCIFPLGTILVICKGKNPFECWGVSRGFVRGWCVGLLCVLPMLILNGIFGHPVLSWQKLIIGAVLAGLWEELIFRGFLFGLLFRYCNWGFVWAALPTAVIFTFGHFYQAHDLMSGLMVFGVTALGSLFFSWLYVEWNNNLWVPIAFHTLMNAVWTQFPVEGVTTSVGSVADNIGRVATIILAIVLTVIQKKKKGKRVFDYKVV